MSEQQQDDTLPGVAPDENLLPQPEDWLDAEIAAQNRTQAARAATTSPNAPASKAKRRSKTGTRAVMGAGVIAICVLGYLNWSGKSDVQDLLGSELPSIPAELIASSLPQIEPVDPRLSGDMDLLGTYPLEHTEAAPATAVVPSTAFELEGLEIAEPALTAQEPAFYAQKTVLDSQEPAADAVSPAVAPAPVESGLSSDNTELLARLERMEKLLALLQQQMELQAKINAAAATSTAAPAQVQAKPVQEAPVRKVAKASETKITPAKRPRQVAAKSVPPEATKTAAVSPSKLSGQLVSVDMWNGQPSVVVSSGLPGDRRVRVLRPGDVINGLALRSADPVSQSATFSAPGSAGLTLFVSQGG